LTTILRLSKERRELRIVDDQIGAPMPAHVVAEITARLVACASARDGNADLAHGIYHLTTSGEVSWFGFAQAILASRVQNSPPPRLIPIPAKEYSSIVQRPANSRLDCHLLSRALGILMPPWQQGLEECLHQMNA
jgi:dTDP-4-dehydrorhamnose reductase